MWAYVGGDVVWFSVMNHMIVYVIVCGCMCGVVHHDEPCVGVCGYMWVMRCVVQCGEPHTSVCERMWVYVWCGSLW